MTPEQKQAQAEFNRFMEYATSILTNEEIQQLAGKYKNSIAEISLLRERVKALEGAMRKVLALRGFCISGHSPFDNGYEHAIDRAEDIIDAALSPLPSQTPDK